jgi:hypothetical protein
MNPDKIQPLLKKGKKGPGKKSIEGMSQKGHARNLRNLFFATESTYQRDHREKIFFTLCSSVSSVAKIIFLVLFIPLPWQED